MSTSLNVDDASMDYTTKFDFAIGIYWYSIGLLSVVFNAMLLFLIIRKSPKYFTTTFLMFLANTAVTDIVSSVVGALVQLRQLYSRSVTLIGGPVQLLGKEVSYFAVTIQSIALCYGLWCFPMFFRFRRNSIIKVVNSSPKKVACQFFSALFASSAQILGSVLVNDIGFGKMFESKGKFGTHLLIIQHNEAFTQVIAISSTVFVIAVFTLSLVYALLIWKSIRNHSSATLSIQLAMPIFLVALPSILSIFIHFGIPNGRMIELLLFPSAYTSFAINPLITMLVVRQYRVALVEMVLRVFCWRKKTAEQMEMTGMSSSHNTVPA